VVKVCIRLLQLYADARTFRAAQIHCRLHQHLQNRIWIANKCLGQLVDTFNLRRNIVHMQAPSRKRTIACEIEDHKARICPVRSQILHKGLSRSEFV
jgi:hypothetical protein